MAATCLGPSTIGSQAVEILTTGPIPYLWPTIGPGGAASLQWPAPVDPDTLVGPNLGDHCLVSMDCDLQGMILTGYVQSNAFCVAILQNPTGVPVNLPQANIRFSVVSFQGIT